MTISCDQIQISIAPASIHVWYDMQEPNAPNSHNISPAALDIDLALLHSLSTQPLR